MFIKAFILAFGGNLSADQNSITFQFEAQFLQSANTQVAAPFITITIAHDATANEIEKAMVDAVVAYPATTTGIFDSNWARFSKHDVISLVFVNVN